MGLMMTRRQSSAAYALILAAIAGTCSATLSARQQLQCSNPASKECAASINQITERLCYPLNSTTGRGLDLSAPCPAWYSLEMQCTYGAEALLIENGNISASKMPMLSNMTQRTCVCESGAFWDAYSGCNDCYLAHGAPTGQDGGLSKPEISALSLSYCAVTMTPTLGFSDWLASWATAGPEASSISSAEYAQLKTSTYSDPLEGSTAVSLYFTASVTGSAAYLLPELTETGSVSVTFTSTKTAGGEIVETGSAMTQGTSSSVIGSTESSAGVAATSSSASSSSSTSQSGAERTAMAAGVGLLGLGAAAVFL